MFGKAHPAIARVRYGAGAGKHALCLAAAHVRKPFAHRYYGCGDGGNHGGSIDDALITRFVARIKRYRSTIMKKVINTPYLMLALALVGICIAFYDAYQLYNGQALWCPPPINGCNEVANSPYARIFSLPVGYYGVVYYLYMFGLAALLAFDPFSRGLRFAAVAYSTLGTCFSIYFMYLQIAFIHAFCIYCLVSAVTTLLLFIAALSHFRATRAPTR
jgi:uncharacterized membrane protein